MSSREEIESVIEHLRSSCSDGVHKGIFVLPSGPGEHTVTRGCDCNLADRLERWWKNTKEAAMAEPYRDRKARLEQFMNAAIQKLNRPENMSKLDWRKVSATYLLDRLEREVEELGASVVFSEDGSTLEVKDECLDVYLIAFMIWDKETQGEPGPETDA